MLQLYVCTSVCIRAEAEIFQRPKWKHNHTPFGRHNTDPKTHSALARGGDPTFTKRKISHRQATGVCAPVIISGAAANLGLWCWTTRLLSSANPKSKI